jgi:hypothetical protein
VISCILHEETTSTNAFTRHCVCVFFFLQSFLRRKVCWRPSIFDSTSFEWCIDLFGKKTRKLGARESCEKKKKIRRDSRRYEGRLLSFLISNDGSLCSILLKRKKKTVTTFLSYVEPFTWIERQHIVHYCLQVQVVVGFFKVITGSAVRCTVYCFVLFLVKFHFAAPRRITNGVLQLQEPVRHVFKLD